MIKKHGFLPMNKKEMEERGWEQLDFVYICGDAYVSSVIWNSNHYETSRRCMDIK